MPRFVIVNAMPSDETPLSTPSVLQAEDQPRDERGRFAEVGATMTAEDFSASVKERGVRGVDVFGDPSPDRMASIDRAVGSLQDRFEGFDGAYPDGLPMRMAFYGKGEEPDDRYAAQYSKTTMSIGVNVDSDKMGDEMKPPEIGDKAFSVGASVEDAMRHEIAHSFANSPAGMDLMEDFRDLPPNVKMSISIYGAANDDEGFAEAFAAYTSPLYEKGTLPKSVERVFDEGLKRK